jgi:hypothetical protein
MTKQKKLKRRVREVMRNTGSRYVEALAEVRKSDVGLQAARDLRRKLVGLASDWLEGKPLDTPTLREVVTAPIDWARQEQVQSEMPLPDSAWPGFIRVLFDAKERIKAEDLPKTSLGPRSADPVVTIQNLVVALRERIMLAKRGGRAREIGLFGSHGALQLLSVELQYCAAPVADSLKAEIRQLLEEFQKLSAT